MASRDPQLGSEGGQVRLDHLSLDAWALCREFVERMVSEAQAAAVRDNPGRPAPEVDWVSIWRAGEGASSDESAMGRVIRAGSEAARRIALGVPEPEAAFGRAVVGPETASDGPGPVAPVAAALAALSAQPGPPTAVVEPAVAETVPAPGPEEPVTSVVETVTAVPAPSPAPAPEDPVTAVVYPAADREEPVTAPVPLATAAVGSLTLSRPDRGVAAVAEPIMPEELPLEEPSAAADDRDRASTRVARNHGWATFFTWMEIVGAFILLFVAWQLWGTAISQHHAQSHLKSEFDAAVLKHHAPKAAASGPTLVSAVAKVPSPPDGSVVARLQIPAIGLDQYVVAGTSADQLSQGPGHYDGTAMPGQAGNVAIAGHRTTHGAPFNRLGQLGHGDRIILTDLSGQQFTYVVSGTPQAVSPNDVAVLNYFGDNRITLTTCTPEYSAAQRLIVVGQLKLPVAAPHSTLAARHVSYHVVNSATASWDWSLLPAVGVELCLLLLLGLSYRRFDFWFGRTAKWFILLPVWAAGLYLLFVSLTSFLPETL
jgi:sortase A